MQNSKGFSLIELMVVVSIIAILSLVAIPSYKGFQARARQKEGLNLLVSYFTVASGAKGEHGIFPGNFKASGFHPTGIINYRVRCDDNPNDIDVLIDDQNCDRTQAVCNCGGACVPFKTWQEAPVGGPGVIGPANVTPVGGACSPPGATDLTFFAHAAAWISGSAATRDVYQINERKILQMCLDGTK